MREYQKKTYLPKDERKTILFLADDIRMHSGIATMARNIVMGTAHKYNWVQVGAAIKHPEAGKAFDLSEQISKETGIPDPHVVLYPNDGYGSPQVVRNMLMRHRIDGILHFTDPRFWIWLYQMEHELREHLPLMFYTIWDDLPSPFYNRDYYESCDWIGCISRQTYGIVNRVGGSTKFDSYNPLTSNQIDYIPHGIDSTIFKPLNEDIHQEDFDKLKKRLFGDKDYEFVVLWNNRNIRRKLPGDVMIAYDSFVKTLPKEKADKCVLLMHTAKVDQNGTDLGAVQEQVCPDINLVFSQKKLSPQELNVLYNMADVTINIASNEGWGLSSTESLMAGTMVINNVTGGLQDQIGLKLNGKHVTLNDYVEHGSFHDLDKWQSQVSWGEWAVPVWPSTRSLVGSVPTPYIFDDRAKWEDVAEAISFVYSLSPEVRKERGLKGREYAKSHSMTMQAMCEGFIDGIDKCLKEFKPKDRYKVYAV